MKRIFIVATILATIALPAHLQQDVVISTIQTANVTDREARVTWQTIIPASSWVEYGLTKDYTDRKGIDNRDVSHSIQLSSLAPGYEYHYRVRSVDAIGNTMYSTDNTFKTSLGAIDTYPPAQVNDLKVVASDFKSVTLEWTAVGDDGINGTATRYDLRKSTSPILLRATTWAAQVRVNDTPRPLLAGTKQRLIISPLPSSETFYFAIRAVDEGNNVTEPSNIVQVTTEPLSYGSFPITQVRILNVSSSGALIQWSTPTPTTTELLLGKSTEYEMPVPADRRRVNDHTMVVGGLESGTEYHLKVQAMDGNGNTATTNDITFRTL